MIDVFVVAPVRIHRDGLSAGLDDGETFRVVGDAPTLTEAAPRLRELRPHVAVLDASSREDVALPPPDEQPDVKLVAVGIPEADAITWIEAGVAGYAPREAPLEQVHAVVSRVARGELVTSPQVAADLLRRIRGVSAADPDRDVHARLTPREAEVLDLVAEGLPNKLIARRLSIQEQTVKNHVHNILLKLGVHRRTEAVARMRARSGGSRPRVQYS